MKTITTKYYNKTNLHLKPPTFKGYRAWDCSDNQIWMIPDSRLTTLQNHEAAALALCNKMNWSPNIVLSNTEDDMVWILKE